MFRIPPDPTDHWPASDTPVPAASDSGDGNGWTDTVTYLTDHRELFTLIGLALTIVLLAVVAWRFWRTGNRSKKIANLAAVVVMVWTSEGLWNVAVNRFDLPAQFAAISFFVFELLLLAAALRAEEERAQHGHPGAAGRYAFVIGGTSGFVSSFGAHNVGEVIFRIGLPMVALGLWWVLLVAPRATDTKEMQDARQRLQEKRDAAWVWTPNKILVVLGLKKPGAESVTEAQVRQTIRRMVAAADTIALSANGGVSAWKVTRARRRLRILARTATPEMVEAVARQQRQAVNAERLMVSTEPGDAVTHHDAPPAPDGDAPSDAQPTQPVTHPGDAPQQSVTHPPVTHPDAPGGTVTRLDAARRDAATHTPRQAPRRTLTHTRTSSVDPVALSDAVASVLAGTESCRAAAKARGLSDASVTRAVRDARQQGDAGDAGPVTHPDAPRDAAASAALSGQLTRPVDAVTQTMTHHLTQPAAAAVNGRMPQLTHPVTQ